MPQGQSLTQGRLADLNHAHASRFQILHFIAHRQGNLSTGVRRWLVIASKGPLQDGNRPREHAFHGASGERLSKLRPAHRHGTRTCHVAVDDGRADTERSIALHPALLCEQHPRELLSEVLDHITALELTMYQHIQADLFLEADHLLDLLLEERFIALTIHLATLIGSTSRTDIRCLRVGTNRRRWQRWKLEHFLLLLFALTMSMRALCHLLVDCLDATGHLFIMNAGRAATAFKALAVDPRRGLDGGGPFVERTGKKADFLDLFVGQGPPGAHVPLEARFLRSVDGR